MSTIGVKVRFMADTFAATDAAGRAEWPPHPVRLLYAAVDAAGADISEQEERALLWLAKQPAPSISCPEPFVRAVEPRPYMPYVPKRLVNDKREMIVCVDTRGLTPRRANDRPFPEVVLPAGQEEVVFVFDGCWPEAVLLDSLDSLLKRVRRLGTHRSPCLVELVREIPPPTWVPRPAHVPANAPKARWLRWSYHDIVDDLRQGWRMRSEAGRQQAELSRAPMPAKHVAYVPTKYAHARGRGLQRRGEIEILRLTGDRFYAHHAVHIASAARVALNEETKGVLASVHGHASDGRPSRDQVRVGVIPLIDAGYRRSDGRIIGIGFVLPPSLEYDVPLLRGLEALRGRSIRTLGRSATFEAPDADTWTLNSRRWTMPSRRWATVTPIVNEGRAQPKKVRKMLRNAALGTNWTFEVSREPRMRGLAPAWKYVAPEHRRWSWRMHLQVTFDEPVAGPILVGPGRWQGWGLLAPLGRS